MTPPSPELVAAVTAAVEARDGLPKGRDIIFRCPSGEHEDRRPSARWDRQKATWVCDVCGVGGGAIDLAGRLGVDLPLKRETVRQNGRAPRLATTTRYPLRDEAGAVVGVHVRRDLDDGSKRVSWEQPDGSPGLGGAKVADLPLYGVRDLGDAPEVVICEGEKAADALIGLRIPAVGTVTGAAGCPSDASLRPLLGRTVLLWPDRDDAGERHMGAVAERLLTLGQDSELVRRVVWPDAPPKGDAADFAESGGTAEAVRGLIGDAPRWEPGAAPPVGPTAIVRVMADVQPKAVDWLWPRWLAKGKLHILGGHPGDGKSTLTAALAAAFSTGGTLPDGTPAPAARTLFLLAEDALDDTLRPRLDLHGADPARVVAIEAVREADGRDRLFNLSEHLPLLEAAIVAHRVDVVVIDPLTSFLPRSDRNAEGDVRDALTPAGKLAERTGVAVLAVMHVGKPNGSGRRPLQQLLGATAFGAIARVVWMVAPVPHDDAGARRVLGVVKSNLAAKPAPLEWSRAEDGPIVWHGASAHDLDELLAGAHARPRDDAEGFLRETLKGGSRPTSEVAARAKAAGFSDATLRRAADAIPIVKRKERAANGRWLWGLTSGDPETPESKVLTPKGAQVSTFDSSHRSAKALTPDASEHLRSAGDAERLRPECESKAPTPPTDEHLGAPTPRIEDAHLSALSGEHLQDFPKGSVGGRCVECGEPVPAGVAGHYCPRHGGEPGAEPEAALTDTVANLLALSADELAAYRVEIAAAPPDDSHLTLDRAALHALDRPPPEGARP